jgi:DNA polymerase (family 10)
MLRLDSALQLLADIATLRGRTTEAAELRSAAERITAAPRGSAEGSRSALVDAALERIEAHEADLSGRWVEAIPSDLRLLHEQGGIAMEDLIGLHRSTGATRLGDFEAALRAGVLPAPLQDRLQQALPAVRAHRRRTPLGRAKTLLDSMARLYLDACPALARLEPTGSARRFDALVGDLELLGAATDVSDARAQLTRVQPCTVLHEGPGRVVLRTEGSELTIRLVEPECFGGCWLLLTGSWTHVEGLRRWANRQGLDLPAPGVDGASWVDGLSEEEIYARLQLPFIPPELREGAGEIEAGSLGALPALITRADVRGDLHMHTDWSDGRDSIDSMVGAARLLGYEYVAVTDHSVSSTIAGGLDAGRLEHQREAVERVRERYPDIAVLHGSEVDILPDGRLDFPDAVLERLDIVLASLHDAAGHDARRLTDRYIAAMRHPLVHIVTHPTNRYVPSRAGYELEESRLFAEAAATGTCLEIDGAPGHLDMDGSMARRAVDAGVLVSVDGDCHRADLLGRHMELAIGTARRGWVRASDAVNSRPLGDLRSVLGRKRS